MKGRASDNPPKAISVGIGTVPALRVFCGRLQHPAHEIAIGRNPLVPLVGQNHARKSSHGLSDVCHYGPKKK
jgi:hypothetical protein